MKFVVNHFKSIEDFLAIKDTCIFCQSKLQAILINFNTIGSGTNYIPNLKGKLIDDKFIFNLKYVTAEIYVHVNGALDIKTGDLDFTYAPNDKHAIYTPLSEAIVVFNSLMPHIELQCSGCKYNYYLSTNVLVCDNNIIPVKIKPFFLYMECFNLDNLWIQNDLTCKHTNIFSSINENVSPIKIPMIKFDSLEKEKLFNKIRTLVTFS